jgi:hypothetical protein
MQVPSPVAVEKESFLNDKAGGEKMQEAMFLTV